MRSRDPNTNVGAIVVDPDNRIRSSGYNGMVASYSESDEVWANKHDHPLIHAEQNAIDFCSYLPRGSKLYVTHSPCEVCSQLIIDVGISEVYYKHPRNDLKQSTLLLEENNIKLINIP